VIARPDDSMWGDVVDWTYHGVITPGMDDEGANPPFKAHPKLTFASITDGLSNTFILGEKFKPSNQYDIWYWSDDKGFHGWDEVDIRSTINNPTWLSNGGGNPVRDFPTAPTNTGDDWNAGLLFGSPHPGGMNALFCDGSVHIISYSINAEVFNALGHRNDGAVLSATDIGF